MKKKAIVTGQEASLLIYALRDSAFKNESEDMQKRVVELRNKVSAICVS
jgi:hypothetical protein